MRPVANLHILPHTIL